MKIVITAENEQEEENIGSKKVEYKNVKEMMLYGMYLDKLDHKEFHTWSGSYPYLIGRTYYIQKLLEKGFNDGNT